MMAKNQKYYSLRMLASSEKTGGEGDAEANHGDVNFVHTGVNNLHSSYEKPSHRTEKDTIERNHRSGEPLSAVRDCAAP